MTRFLKRSAPGDTSQSPAKEPKSYTKQGNISPTSESRSSKAKAYSTMDVENVRQAMQPGSLSWSNIWTRRNPKRRRPTFQQLKSELSRGWRPRNLSSTIVQRLSLREKCLQLILVKLSWKLTFRLRSWTTRLSHLKNNCCIYFALFQKNWCIITACFPSWKTCGIALFWKIYRLWGKQDDLNFDNYFVPSGVKNGWNFLYPNQ